GTPQNLEGERETVTALFADIKGSMDLIEDLDPVAFMTVDNLRPSGNDHDSHRARQPLKQISEMNSKPRAFRSSGLLFACDEKPWNSNLPRTKLPTLRSTSRLLRAPFTIAISSSSGSARAFRPSAPRSAFPRSASLRSFL